MTDATAPARAMPGAPKPSYRRPGCLTRMMMRTGLVMGMLVSMLTWGCGGSSPPPQSPAEGQSYREALELFCNVDARAGLNAEDDPILIGQQRSDWLREQLENPDAIELQTLLSVEAPGRSAEMLRGQAQSERIATCPLADAWEQDADD